MNLCILTFFKTISLDLFPLRKHEIILNVTDIQKNNPPDRLAVFQASTASTPLLQPEHAPNRDLSDKI